MGYITEKDMIVLAPVEFGEMVVTNASAVRFADVECAYIQVKAISANNGNVHVGFSDVTAIDGTADQTTGYELDAGDELLIPLKNGHTNILYAIGTATGLNSLTFVCFG